MELNVYKNEHGHELKVVEIDSDGKRVRVDYGNGHFHWWGEEDYNKWELLTKKVTDDLPAEPAAEPPKRGRKKKQ